MKNSNRKKKELTDFEVRNDVFILPKELRTTAEPYIPRDVTIVDDNNHETKICRTIFYRINDMRLLYERHLSKAGDVVGYEMKNGVLHLSFPRKSIFAYLRRKPRL